MVKKIFYGLLITSITFSCQKKEPFEYPEDPEEVKPTLITEMQRVMNHSEDWQESRSTKNCNSSISESNMAYHEINASAGFALIQLVPTGEGCELDLSLKSEIKDSELTKKPWEELTFEYTFSEYGGGNGSSYIISLYYNELELDLDIAPVIRQLISADTNDGVMKMWFEEDEPNFTINGESFSPDFNDNSGNRFNLDGDPEENYIGIALGSDGQPGQTYTVSQFIRITRFGIEDD